MLESEAIELAMQYLRGEIPISVVGSYLHCDKDIETFHKCYVECLKKFGDKNVG